MTEQMSKWATDIMNLKYAHTKADGTKETWEEIAARATNSVMEAVKVVDIELLTGIQNSIKTKKFMPGGRYLYAAGRPFHQTQNCLLLRAEDSREGWADLLHKASMALMTGAGIGVDYSAVRPEGSIISRTGGQATGPIALMHMLNECGRHIMQGGARRSAIWAGLNWKHQDIFKFIELKDWPEHIRQAKEADFNAWAPMDGTNISVLLDDEFFMAYDDVSHPLHTHAKEVYWKTIRHMLETAEPGFSIDVGENAGETLRNACTEVTSRDDSDICNLGSINMARIDTLEEFKEVIRYGTAFLLAGTVYSHLPYGKVNETRTKNRRLGLGLMGIHEWLIKRGYKYEANAELDKWLEAYRDLSTTWAEHYATMWGLTVPVKTRAIAPCGTISIIAETTSGIEPVFCAAFKRRFLEGREWKYQYVLDPAAKRLVDAGVDPDNIEDAYTLSEDVEKRIAFQAYLQTYVDHAISSTINLPSWGSRLNNENTVNVFGDILMKYLPQLRGVTAYPDGCRSGQPLERVDYRFASTQVGQTFVEAQDICSITNRGACGS